MRRYLSKVNDTYLLLLIAITLFVRVVDWIGALHIPTLGPTEISGYSHFWETLYFHHLTPPLSIFVNGLVYSFGEPFGFKIIFVFLLGLNVLTVYFLYKICRVLSVKKWISFGLCLTFSLVLMRVQTLRWLKYEDLVYGFLPWFIWSLINYHKKPTRRSTIHLAISCGLLILSGTVPGWVSLFLTVMVVVLSPKSKNLTQRFLPLIVPLIIFFVIGLKNYVNVGAFMTVTRGGQNGLQLIWSINSWNLSELFEYAKSQDAPEWWQWCYENSSNGYGKVYGDCYENVQEPGTSRLYKELIALDEKKLAKMAWLDEQDKLTRPWILTFSTEEAARRLGVQYGKVSQKLWLKFIVQRPVTFLIGVINTPCRFLVNEGLLFGIFKTNKAVKTVLLDKVTRLLTYLMVPVWWGGVGVAFLYVFALPIRIGRSVFSNTAKTFESYRMTCASHITPIQLLSFGFVLSTVIFSIGTCCENTRMFWMTAPYLVPLIAVFVDRAANLKE